MPTRLFTAWAAVCASALLSACPLHQGTPPWNAGAVEASWPHYDSRCDAMQTSLPEMSVEAAAPAAAAASARPRALADFDQPVPRIVHQLDFSGGDPNAPAPPRPPGEEGAAPPTTHALWAAWAAEHGWEHILWSERDELALAEVMPEANTRLMRSYLARGDAHGAELIARYSILRGHGGVVADSHLPPPAGCLSEVLDMRGLSCDTDWRVRNYGEPTSSVQVAGLLLAAPPHHRSLVHLEETVVGNDRSWRRKNLTVDHDFTVGKVFLNRSLGGVFSAVSAATLDDLGMQTRRPPTPAPAKLPGGEHADNTMAGLDPRLAGMRVPRLVVPRRHPMAVQGATGGSWPSPPAAAPAAPGQADAPASASDSETPIPPIVHQIWFGDRGVFWRDWSAASALWRRYCAQMNLTYRLWSEADDPQLAEWAGPELWDHMLWYREHDDYRGASDVARYLILKHQGGVYFDLDLAPPRLWDEGPFVDLGQILPMRGLIVASDNHAYDFGNSAIYPMNAVLMSAPHHPVIGHMLAAIPGNHAAWQLSGHRHDPVLVTGPALLSRSLAGSFTVASRGLWRRYFMTDAQQPADGRFMSRQKRRTTR